MPYHLANGLKHSFRLRVPVPLNLCGRFPRGAHNQRRTSFFFGCRGWIRTTDFWLMRPAGTAAPLLCDNLNWHAGVPYGFRSHLLDLKGR